MGRALASHLNGLSAIVSIICSSKKKKNLNAYLRRNECHIWGIYIITKEGISVDATKITIISKWPTPQSVKRL